ncbi:M20/M25/M40 family metallo-hydrolase [Arachnia propionica]|uniref:Vacuolar membrane protease n=1 Tax=Arachnia propionica TaxID=1750 RepID=A0AB37HSM4_9ACTN|nr:M20/M25/M40 family metallo-hydrolase [Arachnia propionica]AFN46286.1 peptidase, M28 family [Arachnia propionica F0230a]QCT37025.1 M20/M25/M40 family metallo-hydrolase [Arachnia propionica]QUC10635.1 M20/M25/M40 family metallo-hydrolase [Arachnia propionica]RPA17523.1 M20/M25/M40 family metallo-hydrolase [Arachnia propionica]
MSRRLLAWLPGLAAALAIIAAMSLFLLPAPKSADSDPTGFSADHAKQLIDTFADEPHSVLHTEAHARSRDEIVTMFKDLGYQPEIHSDPMPLSEATNTSQYSEAGLDALARLNTENIVVRVPGKTDDTMMLTAHYDSAVDFEKTADGRWDPKPGVSSGAADDGYGVATIIETLRAIKADGRTPERSLLIVITDAEELNLLGAMNEMLHHRADYDNVDLIVNIEARGTSGPAVMFETSDTNASATEFFLKNAPRPFATSLMPAVYRMMPNGTDLSIYLKEGFTGLNFASIGNSENYHTASDSPAYSDLTSLQHYGDQVLGLARAWSFDQDTPKLTDDQDRVFFPVFSGFTVHYPATVGVILGVVAIALTAAATVLQARKVRWSRVAGTAWGLTWRIVVSAGAAFLVQFVANSLGLLTSLENNTWIYRTVLYLVPTLLAAALITRFLLKRRHDGLNREASMATLLMFAVSSVLFMILLPGAAYLFVPTTAVLALTGLVPASLRPIAAAVACFAVAVLFAPISWLVAEALTASLAAVPIALTASAVAPLVLNLLPPSVTPAHA